MSPLRTVRGAKSDFTVEDVAKQLLEPEGLQLVSCRPLQQLWAGYGQICEVKAVTIEDVPVSGEKTRLSYILKYICPPVPSETTEDADLASQDEGHIRKLLSYQVEQYFYTCLAPKMPPHIAVAGCIASNSNPSSASDKSHSSLPASTNITAMILNDLRQSYPIAGEKRPELTKVQVHGALKWLGNFHGFWSTGTENLRSSGACVRPPLEHWNQYQNARLVNGEGVWLNGGYSYLATRMTEYGELREESDSEWAKLLCTTIVGGKSSIAEMAAVFLSSTASLKASRPYQTLIHGDVKSENLFTNRTGDKVAFFDFQYIGLGLGVCDLAKLFTCSIPLSMLVGNNSSMTRLSSLNMQQGEEDLLRTYLSYYQEESGTSYDWSTFVKHWETALVDWLRFQASWGFWGNTTWLSARVRSIVDDKDWIMWLEEAISCG